MSERLVTQREYEDLVRKFQALDKRVGRVEVRERADYAFGSFTPAWAGTTIAGTFTYTANATLVEWTRIGNRLSYNGRILITAITVAPTGSLTITGWPFPAVADGSMAIAGMGTMPFWALNVAAGYTDVGLQIVNGSSVMAVVRSGDNVAPAAVAGGELIVGDCRFAGQYRIA